MLRGVMANAASGSAAAALLLRPLLLRWCNCLGFRGLSFRRPFAIRIGAFRQQRGIRLTQLIQRQALIVRLFKIGRVHQWVVEPNGPQLRLFLLPRHTSDYRAPPAGRATRVLSG